MRGSQRRFGWWLTGIGAGAVVVVAAVWLVWPGSNSAPPPRARQYTNFNACLLTGPQGVQSAAAAPVWTGMQSASLDTLAKVSFLSVVGPDAADNAATYLNTLIVRHCDLILAVGPAEVAAVNAQAPSSPAVHFAVVAGGEGAANVAAVTPKSDADTATTVAAVVKKAAHGSFAGGPASS